MRIDLHTHSNRSDGTDTPAELINNAAGIGLDVIALTDHDSTAGWAEADAAAAHHGVTVVHGVEISTRYKGKSIHLLAYEIDPDNVELKGELDRILSGRNDRLPLTVSALQDLGVGITIADVQKHASQATAIGRPHVADALIERGIVSNRDEAFDRYLVPGRPAYIDRYAVDLFKAVELVADAGGISVLAHPWSRGSDRVMTKDAIGQLKSAGLAGIEVDHNDHDAQARQQLRHIARSTGLVITGSSDYHGRGKNGFPLGCNTTDQDQYERLFAQPT